MIKDEAHITSSTFALNVSLTRIALTRMVWVVLALGMLPFFLG